MSAIHSMTVAQRFVVIPVTADGKLDKVCCDFNES
jgi:hypothetical protein